MMMASLYGRLGGDPRPLETKTGATMASCSVAVDVTAHNAEDPETLWLKVLAFGKTTEQLLCHRKGDLISLSGKITQSRWIKDGVEQTNLQIIADTVISAKTVRPYGKKKASPETDT